MFRTSIFSLLEWSVFFSLFILWLQSNPLCTVTLWEHLESCWSGTSAGFNNDFVIILLCCMYSQHTHTLLNSEFVLCEWVNSITARFGGLQTLQWRQKNKLIVFKLQLRFVYLLWFSSNLFFLHTNTSPPLTQCLSLLKW